MPRHESPSRLPHSSAKEIAIEETLQLDDVEDGTGEDADDEDEQKLLVLSTDVNQKFEEIETLEFEEEEEEDNNGLEDEGTKESLSIINFMMMLASTQGGDLAKRNGEVLMEYLSQGRNKDTESFEPERLFTDVEEFVTEGEEDKATAQEIK